MSTKQTAPWQRWGLGLAGLALLAGMTLWPDPLLLAQQGKTDKDKGKGKPKEADCVAMDVVSAKDWQDASTKPLTGAELDQMINGELAKGKVKAAPLASDEQFLRRVYLDVVGKIPSPAEILEFKNDTDKDKRAKVIDKLLASDDHAKHWGRYWKQMVTSRVTDQLALISSGAFERWLTESWQKNVSWGEMVTEMLTASGEMKFKEPDKNGQAFFLLAFKGADALTERTAEVSRMFMGIQLQCAQCHDHPFDDWKRKQFHELAAYLVRTKDRFIFDEDKKIVGVTLFSTPFGEHKIVDKDKKLNDSVNPKFIDGKAPPKGLADKQRRAALAKAITSKDNPWFAAAFVNRIWSELLGQSFYQPVDDIGPQREAVMPKVVARLAGAFRGGDYNIKELFRVMLNSEAYQRQSKIGKSTDEHLFFAASYPKRLNSDALWNSLECALGNLGGGFGGKGGKGFGGGPFGQFGLKGQFTKEFGYDPSSRPEEVEGTLPQALLMMNNPAINQKIKATGFTMLSTLLKKHEDNDAALKQLYLTVLCRYPTANETKTCLAHLQQAKNRGAGFEDILWVLINSTEFQTKR